MQYTLLCIVRGNYCDFSQEIHGRGGGGFLGARMHLGWYAKEFEEGRNKYPYEYIELPLIEGRGKLSQSERRPYFEYLY